MQGLFTLGSVQRYMICVTLFLHVVPVRKHTDMLELHVKLAKTGNKICYLGPLPSSHCKIISAELANHFARIWEIWIGSYWLNSNKSLEDLIWNEWSPLLVRTSKSCFEQSRQWHHKAEAEVCTDPSMHHLTGRKGWSLAVAWTAALGM